MCLELKLAKFKRSSARRTFSKVGLNVVGGKKCAFSTENWPYVENDGLGPRLSLIANKKWHRTPFRLHKKQ